MQKPESNTIAKQESSETDLSGLSLEALASRLNEREASIAAARDEVISKAAWTIKRAVEQGRDLCEVKNRLKHGEWMIWLEVNCPAISDETARRCMRLYEKFPTVGNLDGKTLTQLYIGCGLLPGPESGEHAESGKGERGPAIFQLVEKTCQWFSRGLVNELKPEERHELKEKLRPIWEAL